VSLISLDPAASTTASSDSTTASYVSSKKVIFAASSNSVDVKAYTVTVYARFVGITTWPTSATATYTYNADPCLTATVTASPHPNIITSVFVPGSSSAALWYDSVSGSAATPKCGAFSVVVTKKIKPATYVEATMGVDFIWSTTTT
jgi:hypothetical protein